MEWLGWGEDAFAEAKRLERPVFLFIAASWCRFSKRMEREVLSDPGVASLLANRFVAVKVDKDRRPEVNDRYNVGGWPSLCVLTADGELITGGTSFTVEALKDLLERVARYYAEKRSVIASALQELLRREEAEDRARARRSGVLSDAILEKVRGAILEEFDEEHGGFGRGQKFPHSESLDFALVRYVKSRDPRLKEVVDRTLTHMAESPIHDAVDGGFFRYSTSRDWRAPHTEKLLESNAALLRNYLEAFQVFDRPAFRRVAEEIVSYLRDHLRHPEHPAFGGSQDSDDAYYALSLKERRKRPAPAIDPTIYVNWNAAAVSALFKASAVLGDPGCAELAEATLAFLLEECYDPGRGMYHYHDGGPRILGLLTDQAYTARALIHAAQFTGERRHLDVAEDLLRVLLAKQTGSHGGFYDIRADDLAVGSMRRRNQSILENGMIAEVFLRVYHLTLKPEYLETAERTLKLFAEDYHLYGYFTAGYARAVELYLHPPVHAVIVGSRADDLTGALVRAATRLYLPSKLVQVIDPEQDKDLLERFELPAKPRPVAYVNVRTAHVASVSDPDALVREMESREREDG
ncbi:MAG: thioredoxin domain-containing protein [Planctomycetes bacterium]|nr:thioredoxin domain-containing protein [Planctomycetota bacterium]